MLAAGFCSPAAHRDGGEYRLAHLAADPNRMKACRAAGESLAEVACAERALNRARISSPNAAIRAPLPHSA